MNYRYCFIIILISVLSSCSNKSSQEYINDGIRHTEREEYDKAMSSFKKAIKADPNNAFAHYTLAGIYTFKEMHDKAIEEYKKAIELDPSYPDPHYSLGFVYEKLGMGEEAKEEFLLFDKLKNIGDKDTTNNY